ncbi:MAG TPA: hypothetical protein DEQ09_08960, partial [Bacteroidales bacterium]|nr:hypothetical protein [Bacteroidales bacterium]
MRKLGGESKNAEKQVNKSFTNMQTKVRKFAMYFGAALGGAAVVGAIKKSIDAMKEFEQTFSNVLTLLSAAERKKFGGFLKEGSINLMRNYGFAVQDVNKALFDSISAGIKAGDSIKFMNEAAKLAKGGVTSLSIAVDGMTSIMNAYGLSAKDAEKVSAAFFTAQKYGKCFAKGTEILMFNGNIKKVEDIIVGDQLMGNDNKPRNVLALGKGREMMYEIIMRDGSMYTVNGSHILSLKERYGYNSSKKRITNITVNDYLKKSISFKRRTYGYKPQIPLSFKNQYDPKYSSYLLGLWIADGRKDNVTISVNNKDIEIMDFLYKQASENNCKISIRNIQKNSSDISLVYYKKSNPIKRYLKELDIYNNKHIPHKLKSMSIKNRLEFLAGYLDGDGYLLKGNTVCYSCSSSNKSIIDGIQFIAGSLGFSAKYKYRERFDKRTNKIYQEHSLIIGGDIERIPVKLKRKQINYKTRKYDWNIYSFKVKKVGVGDYYGFNIDGNRLFVLNHFNVTHNTTVEELASSIGRVAPIMKTAGISYQEGLSALALLTAQGISTEESVTALRATIQALIRPTTQSTKIFKELGIETGIVAIRNNGLGKTLLDVAKATKTDADKLAELIPNVRALTGIAALGEEALQKYDVILKEVNEDYGDGSSLAQAYTLQSSTLAESINRLKGAASAAKIKLGGMFAPIIKGFADLIAPMQETSELLIKERTELNLLIGAITNSSNTQESRLRLIEQLNVEYPDFLEGLDTEKVSNEELKTALEDVNAEYEKKIQLSVAQEIYALQSEKLAKLALEETNLIEKQNKVLDKNADKLIGLQTIGKGRIAIKAGLVLGMVNESNALAKNMIALDDNREAQAKLNKQAQISIERLNELRSLYGDDKSAGGGGVVTEETVIQTSKWLDEMFKKYGQYFAKVDASQDEWFMKLENDDILHEMAGVINKKYYDDLEVASEETKREQLKAIYDEMFKDIEATEEKKRLIKEATFDA